MPPFPIINANNHVVHKTYCLHLQNDKTSWHCVKGKQMDVPEAELLERHSLDLRQLLFRQLVLEAVAGEEVEADP